MTKQQMERIAVHVLTSAKYKEAAEKAGISESTLYKLRKRKAFQRILDETKNMIFREAVSKAQGYTFEAVEVLRSIMNNKKSSDRAKIAAARAITDLGMDGHIMGEIIVTHEDLEQMYDE